MVAETEVRAPLEPSQWRGDLLRTITRGGLVLGGITYLPSVWAAVHFGVPIVAIVDTLAMALVAYVALAEKRSFRFRAVAFSLVMFGLGVLLMTTVGSVSQIYLLAFSLLLTLLLGLRAGALSVGLNAITMLAVGYFGFASPEMSVRTGRNDFASWAVITLNFVFINSILAGALGVVIGALESALGKSLSAHKSLSDERAQLLEANEALRAKDILLEIAGRTAHIGGWSVELPSERVVWSDEVCAIHEVPPGTRVTLTEAMDYHLPDSRSKLERAVENAIREGTWYDLETEIVTARGNRVWGRAIGRPAFDEAGRVVRIEGSFQDITSEKRASAEREKLEQELQHAQKMEAVGRLAGGVAHDFNNMLSVILGHAHVLIEDLPEEDERRFDLERIIEASERSASLTSRLLAFARRQTIVPRVIDLNTTLASVAQMLERLIGEDVELAFRPADVALRVRMDPSQLDQILANLVVNARDAIERFGTVVLATSAVDVDETSADVPAGTKPGAYVRLSVTDDGSGMDASTRARLFEPFFTTKAPGKGTGLGLATVYGIVQQNGGFITVSSEVGRGSTFFVHFPRTDEAPTELAPIDDARPLPRGSETILLVEDEGALLRLGKQLLENLGYRVLDAASPERALELAAEHEHIDLLLTDVIMPKMTGREVWQILSARRPTLRCLYSSGYTADVMSERGVVGSDVHFLAKPFTFGELARKVRKALDEPRATDAVSPESV